MRRLILMRHAKSDWSQDGAPDHSRPLARRGRLAAALMGAWLRDQAFDVDRVLCSDSVRTRQTLERMRAAWLDGAEPPDTAFDATIYEAEPDAVLDAIRATPADIATLLVIGHNPGVEETSDLLTGGATADVEFPTAAAAIYEIPGAWADLAAGGARFIAAATPKSLV